MSSFEKPSPSLADQFALVVTDGITRGLIAAIEEAKRNGLEVTDAIASHAALLVAREYASRSLGAGDVIHVIRDFADQLDVELNGAVQPRVVQ